MRHEPNQQGTMRTSPEPPSWAFFLGQVAAAGLSKCPQSTAHRAAQGRGAPSCQGECRCAWGISWATPSGSPPEPGKWANECENRRSRFQLVRSCRFRILSTLAASASPNAEQDEIHFGQQYVTCCEHGCPLAAAAALLVRSCYACVTQKKCKPSQDQQAEVNKSED